jgi:exodeoxyribonuclease VII large subunit
VIASGKLTTYPGRSKYQIVVSRMELAGEGALMALLDKRRRALAAEGLFDEAKKRRLPFLPRVIGVVTSPTGAVIRDILHRLEDRCPTHVIVWPVPVQGEGAAEKVAAAIRGFANMTPRPDLLIVARGGGSIEDLWAFNEEEVVRAAAASPIPLISAVGHETDTTLIDFASDRRAPTPTAAAEMAVPVRSELAAMLAEFDHRMSACVTRTGTRAAERLDQLASRWPEAANLFAPFAQRIDDIGDRLPRALVQRTAHSPRRPCRGGAAAAGAAAHRAGRARAGEACVPVAAGGPRASRAATAARLRPRNGPSRQDAGPCGRCPGRRGGGPSLCRWAGCCPYRRRFGTSPLPSGQAQG